jgi:FlaG/FlaF family flagellin (archaellin)
MIRDVTLSVLVAVAIVLAAHIVAWATASYPAPDPETWFSPLGP